MKRVLAAGFLALDRGRDNALSSVKISLGSMCSYICMDASVVSWLPKLCMDTYLYNVGK